jgi:hypothetical protein
MSVNCNATALAGVATPARVGRSATPPGRPIFGSCAPVWRPRTGLVRASLCAASTASCAQSTGARSSANRKTAIGSPSARSNADPVMEHVPRRLVPSRERHPRRPRQPGGDSDMLVSTAPQPPTQLRTSFSASLGTKKDARKIGKNLFPVHRKPTISPSAASKV